MIRHLSDEGWQAIAPLLDERLYAAPNDVISHRGDLLGYSLLLLDGLVARSVPRAGSARSTFVALQFPGDFVDLHAFPLRRLDHDVVSLTQSTMAVIHHEPLKELLDGNIELSRNLWFMTLVDASIHRHWVMRNSALRAFSRVANLLCEYDMRMNTALGEVRDSRPFAITQMDIADATGLTNVHVSRMLRDLREDGCCTVNGGSLNVIDRDKMQKRGEFDAAYLYLPDNDAVL